MVGAVRFELSILISENFGKTSFRPHKYRAFLRFRSFPPEPFFRTKTKLYC